MPGHENRGGTFVVVPTKVFDHHDASSRKSGEWGSLGLILDGSPRGIPGPLSNAQVARCLDGVPRIAWVADGTCSHAGAGSGLGLPTNAANPRTYGVEKANDGIGEPYTAAANYATNALFHAMAVESGGDPGAYAWGHKEWTPRKIDPTYSMHDRRRQVGAFTPASMEDDMPTAKEVAETLLDYPLVRKSGDQTGQSITLRNFIEWSDGNFLNVSDRTVKAITPILSEALEQAGGTSAGGSVGSVDLDALAERIIEKLGTKLQS